MSSSQPEKRIRKYSEEVINLTKEVKNYTQSYNSWEDAGADIVGMIHTESLDKIPSYRIDWTNEYTIKTASQMERARSIIVLGYHASDDIYEAILRKGNRMEPYEFLPSGINQRKVVRFLQAKGFEAKIASDLLPKKQMARLAGFGNYGKNSMIITPKYGPWIRLGAIITDAEFVYDESFEKDLCGDCERCVKACPTGALAPYRVDHSRCLVNPFSDDWVRLISGELKYSEKLGKTPDIDSIFDLHSPRFTENSRLMCTTCQRACPYGRKERGLDQLEEK